MAFHPLERAALVAALEAAGPGRPTLCAGWSTEHLAAHVVLRERNPLAAAGIGVPFLAARTERVTQREGDRAAASSDGWRGLLGQLADGPPLGRLHPLELVGDAAQLVELFVHAEDVRRGDPHRPDAAPRARSAGHTAALWQGLRRMAGPLYRRTRLHVVLRDDDGHGHEVGSGPRVVVRGDVGELVLHAFGRSTAAHVTLEGDDAAVRRMRDARPGPVAG